MLSKRESEKLESCAIGEVDLYGECHKTVHVRRTGLKHINSMSPENQELLRRRSGIEFSTSSYICLHHEALLVTKYSFMEKTCCNPFMKENHYKTKSLRIIDINTTDTLNKLTKKDIRPGQKLCTTCRLELHDRSQQETESTSSGNEDSDVIMEVSTSVNTSFGAVGISPLKFQKVSERDCVSYGKRKVQDVHKVIAEKVAFVSGIDPKILNAQPSTSNQCLNCVDYKNLIEDLKKKMLISKRPQKIQILTLVPKTWSIQRTMCEFGVSEYLVRQARHLKNEIGILALPKQTEGKKISDEVKQRIKEFYEDDEFSRMCPGMKDFVSVRIEGEKVKKNKRLLLSNLKEIFIAYREKHGPEVGFSKFCELRPKWCVPVTSSGMHRVCVCMHHQNVKLMIVGSDIKEDYKQLITKTVCNIECKDCMLHRCEVCPGEDGLKKFLTDTFEEKDPEDLLVFKQWIHTDRDTLDTKQLSIEDYITELSSKVWSLSTHHYIAKQQSQYLKTLKENLPYNELVILMDFAENYSFVVQDAVQGFHWENSQATLHPFVVYYKKNEELKNINICMISDCLKHNTVAVNVFLKKLIEYLKEIFENINYIHYFSDGALAQYKNYKNFINLCHHEEDFGIKAAWNFFATSHGKSPCDGIGGTAKRLARSASLQRTTENHILTPRDLFIYCDEHIDKIKFFYIPKCDIETMRPKQENRFRFGHTLAGTRENHYFVPIDKKSIQVRKVSRDTVSFIAHTYSTSDVSGCMNIAVQNLQPGQYVVCMYDTKWWIGNICETSSQNCDALVTFMHPCGPADYFYWPDRKDECWIPEQHIVANIAPPSVTSSGRKYNVPKKMVTEIEKKFKLTMDSLR